MRNSDLSLQKSAGLGRSSSRLPVTPIKTPQTNTFPETTGLSGENETHLKSTAENLPQDQAWAKTDVQIAAMAQSIRALHLLLSLRSMSSRSSTKFQLKISATTNEVDKHLEKYERLIGAIRVLEEDLQAERCKLKRFNGYSVYADIARLCLFIVGLCAFLIIVS